mmetsp:Transcript_37838/g.84548  ORF Transcript_37838/g.84548 Transcript_37838/m.84548 type:complete len:153 (-) Transcript_37838:134-592(-)
MACTVNELFGKMVKAGVYTPAEVNEQKRAADATHCDGDGDGGLAGDEPEGGAEEEAELGAGGGGTGDLPLRRYPLAPMSLQGNWRELGEAKLANFARDRAAERAKEERKKAQLEEAAARHIARSSEAMARISRLKKRSAEAASPSGQEALPE